MKTPTTLQEIVADIIASMSDTDKTTVIHTAEKDLILFHNDWGRGIRNHYNLWQNGELVRSTGENHPDDASGVIIKAVWEALQASWVIEM